MLEQPWWWIIDEYPTARFSHPDSRDCTPAVRWRGKHAIYRQPAGAPPLCTVNDKGGRIDVRFERNIAVNRIDGERYRQAILYQIECPGAAGAGITWHMRLNLHGEDVQFAPTALKTSVKDLGIRVLLSGTALVPNKPREIDVYSSTPPVLEAVPVERKSAALPSIGFTASALLMAELY